jgi:hypothetical protein
LDALGGAVLTVGMVPLLCGSLSRIGEIPEGDFTRLQQCFINNLAGGAPRGRADRGLRPWLKHNGALRGLKNILLNPTF